MLGVMDNFCDPSTQNTETGRYPRAQEQPRLHNEFQVSGKPGVLGFCLGKQTKEEQKRKQGRKKGEIDR